MPTLKQIIVSIFSGGLFRRTNGEVAAIQAAAERDADFAVDTYFDRFETRAIARLQERQRRLIGLDHAQPKARVNSARAIAVPSRRR